MEIAGPMQEQQCTLYGFVQEFCTYPKIRHHLIMMLLKIAISDLIAEICVFSASPISEQTVVSQFAVVEMRFTLTCAVPRMVPSAAVEASPCPRGRSWHWKPSCIEVTRGRVKRPEKAGDWWLVMFEDLKPSILGEMIVFYPLGWGLVRGNSANLRLVQLFVLTRRTLQLYSVDWLLTWHWTLVPNCTNVQPCMFVCVCMQLHCYKDWSQIPCAHICCVYIRQPLYAWWPWVQIDPNSLQGAASKDSFITPCYLMTPYHRQQSLVRDRGADLLSVVLLLRGRNQYNAHFWGWGQVWYLPAVLFRCSIIVCPQADSCWEEQTDQTQIWCPETPRTFMVHPETMDYVPNDAKFTSVQEIRHLRCFYQGHPGTELPRCASEHLVIFGGFLR